MTDKTSKPGLPGWFVALVDNIQLKPRNGTKYADSLIGTTIFTSSYRPELAELVSKLIEEVEDLRKELQYAQEKKLEAERCLAKVEVENTEFREQAAAGQCQLDSVHASLRRAYDDYDRQMRINARLHEELLLLKAQLKASSPPPTKGQAQAALKSLRSATNNGEGEAFVLGWFDTLERYITTSNEKGQEA